jgi:kynurenine 3-monooxygenase
MEVHGDNWNTILQEFQQSRKPDSDAIADMALNNFVEMRDKVSDKKFLLQKKIESAFSKKYPDQWIPAYAQVTFSPHIRYSQALQNSLKQEAIMKEVMALPRIEEIWDQPAVEEKMLELLSNQTQ